MLQTKQNKITTGKKKVQQIHGKFFNNAQFIASPMCECVCVLIAATVAGKRIRHGTRKKSCLD